MSPARPVVIFGTGGQGRELHELLLSLDGEAGAFELLGWLDDDDRQYGRDLHGLPVLGGLDWVARYPDTGVLLGIGMPAPRARVASRLRQAGARHFPSLIHPQASVGRRVRHGMGLIATAGSVATTDLQLGDFVLLNVNSSVGHDCRLADFVTVSPGAVVSGNVTLGEGVNVGAGATIIQGLSVGAWSVVGAGASVIRSLPADVTAVGVPARVVRQREAGWQENNTG